MNKHEIVIKSLDAIMKLKGADEFKEMVKRLHIFFKNKEAYPLTDVMMPNYLLIAKRGGGITTLVNAFADYLHAAKIIEFYGTEKFFEFNLDYVPPEKFFSELARLDNTIFCHAGHNRFYKGVVCINIDEWLEHTSDEHFATFLDYISSNNDKLLVVFCIHTDANNVIETLEYALSSHIRFESLSLRFPDTGELVELVESRFLRDKGFSFTKKAKALLSKIIMDITAGKHFNGFRSIEQLAKDIMHNIVTAGLSINKSISANMLSCYGKNSIYVKRVKGRTVTDKRIGFTAERGM